MSSTAGFLGTRQDTFLVALMVEDMRAGHFGKNPPEMVDWGIWDTKTGGDLDSEERLYYPGGMKDPYSLGGRILPQQVTLTRNYRIHRDHFRIQELLNSVGKANIQISVFPMDKYGAEHTPAIVYRGTLKTVTLPEHNSESSSDPAMLSVVCTIDSAPTAVGANK